MSKNQNDSKEREDEQGNKGNDEFLLCRDQDRFAGQSLNLRSFDMHEKIVAYSRQNGICPICLRHFTFAAMEGVPIQPWSMGGQTTLENCQMLCKACNAKKQ